MTKVSDEVKRAAGVTRRKGSTVWQWGIKSPKDLRHRYPDQWAHRCSLKTSDLRTANERAAALRAEWLARFAEQRKAATAQPLEAISPELGRILADRLYSALMVGDEQLRDDTGASQRLAADLHRAVSSYGARALTIGGRYSPTADLTEPLDPLDGRPPVVRQVLTDLNASALAGAVVAQAAQNLRPMLPMIQTQAAAMGLKLDERTLGIRDALKEAQKAHLRAREDIARRDAGEVVETPASAPPTAAPAVGTPTTLRQVFARWQASKSRTAASVGACERALALFEERFGTPRLQDITRATGDAFRAHLLTLKLASKTKHDRMTWAKSLLKYACRDLEAIPRNPWEGLDIEHKTEQRRAPWTADQLRTFFAQPLFTDYHLPRQWRAGGAAAYWVPLLGLFTGARVGELCQLRVADIDATDGAPVLHISDDAEGTTVKTEAGIRSVPIHSELVRLGLLDYADAMREAGEVSLWPALKFRKGKPGGYFSAWFGEFRRDCALAVPDFHSFRHTVRTAMTEARVAEPVQDRITGHGVQGSTGTRVYSHPKAVLREAVESIKYPGLCLPAVYRR